PSEDRRVGPHPRARAVQRRLRHGRPPRREHRPRGGTRKVGRSRRTAPRPDSGPAYPRNRDLRYQPDDHRVPPPAHGHERGGWPHRGQLLPSRGRVGRHPPPDRGVSHRGPRRRAGALRRAQRTLRLCRLGESPMGEFCETSRDGHVLTVTINRPEVMNALHPPANAELAAVWDSFAADPDLWIGIITGAGDRAFSAGNDLKYQASGGDMSGQPASGFAGLTSRFDLDKPVIAAVNGVAMGGGFEIALACDIIVASEQAVFALPEPRVGL